MSQIASLNDVSDEVLGKILKYLLIPEQVTFAKVCERFRHVYINWSKIHNKHYKFHADFESERERRSYFRLIIPDDFDWRGGGLIFPREDQKLYFEMVGPYIETIHVKLTVFLLRVISVFCVSLQEISAPLDLDFLVPLIHCRSLQSIYLIGDEDYSETTDAVENFITCLTKLPHLTKLRVVKTYFHGEALSKFLTLEELILIHCPNILPVNIISVFEKITHLQRLYLPMGLQYTDVFRNMARNCQYLTELSCFVSCTVRYEVIAQLPQLRRLQLWSNDEVIRPALLADLVKEKAEQLEVLRIYNAQITIRDAYLIGKLTGLRELKAILPHHVNNFRALDTLENLEYLQIYDFTDADNYILFNVDKNLPYLISKLRRLRSIYLSYCRELTIEFIHTLIPIIEATDRLYEGPLMIFTYGSDIDECVLYDGLCEASQHLIRIYFMSLTRPQVNSLSLMNNYFQ